MVRCWNSRVGFSCEVACLLTLLHGAPAAALEARYHHVHLNVTDAAAGSKWYADMLGGQAKKVGFFSATGFGKTTLIFFQAKPGFAGSRGSVVDHIGFSYPDLPAKLKQLEEAKVEIVSPIEQEGPIKYAFIKDPWGTLIELVEDPEIQGFHHVHLAVPDPQAALDWYQRAFGGETARFAGLVPGIRNGDVWLLVKKVDQPLAATKGRSIDHLSWAYADLDDAARQLKGYGVTFESEPFAFGTGKIAFILDPHGVRIELVGPASPKK
jgi:catechol 2,3-dioxygenase-like lactoylglutathione lyase family enzyme